MAQQMKQDDIKAIESQLMLDAIKLRYGYDFTCYAPATINRRLQEVTDQYELQHISELLAKILYEPTCFSKLLQHITIPVTEFFRDPKFFLSLRQQVFPILKTYPSIKIWHAGCASGEEVYSMAIALAEEDLLSQTTLYATDINAAVLEQAKSGIYSYQLLEKAKKNYHISGGKVKFENYICQKQVCRAAPDALRPS